MRLIDADALKETMKIAVVKHICTNTLYNTIMAVIDGAQTVPIVDITQRDLCADISCEDCPFMQETCKLMDYVAYADRPHGEWIRRDNYKVMGEGYIWHCSICDEKVYQDSSRDYPHENFCPSCGADMRKETE